MIQQIFLMIQQIFDESDFVLVRNDVVAYAVCIDYFFHSNALQFQLLGSV